MRAIHLKPVNVSAECTPWAAAIFDSNADDTSVVTTSRSSPVVLAEQVVGEQPADLVATQPAPRAVGQRDRRAQPVGVGIVGDRHVGADLARPRSSSRSIAPGSSGLGNDTVGNVPSGSNCSATTCGAGRPAASNARISTAPPTPCIAV